MSLDEHSLWGLVAVLAVGCLVALGVLGFRGAGQSGERAGRDAPGQAGAGRGGEARKGRAVGTGWPQFPPARYCYRCGTAMRKYDVFCRSCGTRRRGV